MTSRHNRRHQNANGRPIPVANVSDYDSDMTYSAPHEPRTPDEINYTVIKRYVPSLQAILAIAASASIYVLTPDKSSEAGAEWKRAEIEGTLFVCELDRSPTTGTERHCIVVLNRKGIDNLIIESGEIDNVEITAEFLTLRFQSNKEERILGFFLQSSIYPREYLCELIQQHWEAAKQAQAKMGASYHDEVIESIEAEVGYKPMGRRLSLTELFGQR